MMCASAVRFAGGGDAHDEPAVQIHRAGEKFAAGFFVGGNGFAGEHGFVHGGFAFEHNAVHRHAVAGLRTTRSPICNSETGTSVSSVGPTAEVADADFE